MLLAKYLLTVFPRVSSVTTWAFLGPSVVKGISHPPAVLLLLTGSLPLAGCVSSSVGNVGGWRARREDVRVSLPYPLCPGQSFS